MEGYTKALSGEDGGDGLVAALVWYQIREEYLELLRFGEIL